MTRIDWQSTALCALLAGGGPCVLADAALQAPPGYTAPVKVKPMSDKPCAPGPAPFTGPLDFTSKYAGSGKTRDEINPQAEEAYRRSTESITAMEKGFMRLVGRYMTGEERCALDWIDGWAQAHALEGEASSHTGKSLRKWALGSLSGSWLKLKFSSSMPLFNYPRQTARVEAWLGTLADQVVREWSPGDPLEKINNHYYWAAWALMSTAVVTNRRDLFEQSLTLFRIFERQIDADGYLPNELARGKLAANYHNYSMLPLAMIAAFGKANGIDLASESDHALVRLALRAQQSLDDPSSFQSKTGVAQEAPDADSKTNWSWIEPYCWTVQCDASLLAKRAALRPIGTTRLGGDLTSVFPAASTQ